MEANPLKLHQTTVVHPAFRIDSWSYSEGT